MLLIITSTGDRLFRFINIDDLERLWTLKILILSDFLAILGCKRVNCDEMDGDRLRLPANRNCYRLSRVSWALLKLLVFNRCRVGHRPVGHLRQPVEQFCATYSSRIRSRRSAHCSNSVCYVGEEEWWWRFSSGQGWQRDATRRDYPNAAAAAATMSVEVMWLSWTTTG